jgi:hypothetical protein
MGEIMNGPHALDPDTIDEATGLTLAEMEAIAEDLYEHRHEIEAESEEVPAEFTPDVRSVVSVRFNRGEIGKIAAAANAAGLPLSTYVRNTALASAIAIDLEGALRELQTASRALAELGRTLGAPA